ncbi:acyl-[ACP]--phospholipid O-acyltransferase [Legionella impletisoli]|uniref:Acyl-[ACP]--phospholipid O-acyltransferase n=1 Tax=Legionella impletisoli TaxID=343510 RepID=A0A917NCL7_9GAMM|nr:acyl-[ACP]--phospholipid O-acyltransferase [Legionella impletisoli]GGI88242.1 acyl-[ACP]--phospholipid O-acyltransferase [Legionella impletisoli]
MKLFSIRGCYPFMLVVFLNTFVDIGHKILMQDTLYQTTSGEGFTILSAIVNGLILLPYILLFTPSGFLADKFPKASTLKLTAVAVIPLTILITFCYYQGYFWGAFALTFLLAVQSAINSPAKYGYIKELFGKEHISQANAFVQTLTIAAILGSTFVFTLIFSHYLNALSLLKATERSLVLKAFAPAGLLLIACSLLESLLTFRLPKKLAADPESNYKAKQYFKGQYLASYIKKTTNNPIIMTCIVGLAIFWGVNQVLLATYGAFLKDHISNTSVVFAQGSLAFGGIGIVLGALYAGKLSKGFIETGIIPVATIGAAIALFILPTLSNPFAILALFLTYGFWGGMLIVPLNALIQFNAPKKELGKILSANNFVQTCVMFGFLALTALVSLLGLQSIYFLYALGAVALAGSIYALFALPQSLIRYLLYCVVSKFYSVSVYQLNHLPSTGGVLLLGNHTSFIDWAVLQIACPRPIRFVMERSIYEKWYLKWLLKQFKIIPIGSSASKDALREIHAALNQGEVIALFPEGRLSRNGQVGAFHSGFERAAEETNAVIVPFYLHGLWGAKTSYATEHYKDLAKMNNRRVSVIYGEPMANHASALEVRQTVRELSIKSWKYFTNEMDSIQLEWFRMAKHQGNAISVIDSSGSRFSAHKLLAAVIYFAKKLAPKMNGQSNIGIILPASAAGVIANLAILCRGKTVVNLNYTAGDQALRSAIEQANIKTIITSHVFLDKLNDKGFNLKHLVHTTHLVHLEDLKKKTAKVSIARNLLAVKFLPAFLLKHYFIKQSDVNSVAAILFSSGSEGKPKGVELTHRNLLSNIKQVTSVFAIQEDDVMLNSLPLFHAFGLTMTTLVPLIQGLTMVCYPDPTNALAIARLIYSHRITMFCATSTFLSLYNRNPKIHPLLLKSLRLVISGAEKLSPTVREEFKNKFNHDIYEGYGATEVAPVASCNLPDVISPSDWHIHQGNKPGTVGLALPGSAFRIVDPNTLKDLPIGEEGLILIGGTQVMRGYLNDVEKTEDVLIQDGDIVWYKTGDKGRLDEEGYLTIVDRYSRFAKIGGEMISLGQVEEQFSHLFNDPDLEVIAVSLPDAKKGECIGLIYSGKQAPEYIMSQLKTSNIPRLMLPNKLINLEGIPKLASGKKDYATAKKLMLSNVKEKIAI